MSEPPRILHDPTTGRPILMSPERQRRPILTAGDSARGGCPFCAGNEAQTPAEISAARVSGRSDTAGGEGRWTVRAFPNLYPATEHHEVIAEGAEHLEHPADLPVELWSDALRVWSGRLLALESLPGVVSTYLFKNVGLAAGASIAHNHSQLLGLPVMLPRLGLEQDQIRRLGHCPFCAALHGRDSADRIVYRDEHHAVVCPATPKLPFETWLLPLDHDDEFTATAHTGSLARTLHALFRALDGALQRPPFNMYLHRIRDTDFHWHFEVQPRTGNLAGLEIGGDMYMNAVPGAEAAARLRRGLAVRRDPAGPA